MKRRTFILILLTALTFLLTSCWDRREINDMAFVIATGFDKGSEPGTIVSSVQVPLISAMGGAGSSGGGGGTSGASPYFVDGAEGRNVRESNMNLQQRMSRNLYFAHRRVVVIGEDLAKAGMKEILNLILIEPQSRLSTFLLMSKGKASEMLNTPSQFEKLPGEAIREMAKNSIGVNANDVLQEMQSPGLEPIIPVVEKGSTHIKTETSSKMLMNRFAVLKDDKVRFTTNEEESGGVLWIRNKMRDKSITFPYKNEGEISLKIIQGNMRKKMKMVRGRPSFTITVNTTGILMENEPYVNLEHAESYQKMIQEFEKAVKKQITALLKHAHAEGSDVVGFGYYLYRNHNRSWEKEWQKDWRERLKDLEVTVNVEGDIQRMTNIGLKSKE
ncbi:Ger(x)C family spore germination protein [Bacillus sp. FJAT-27251]|uniref:Ger(x)C family spore germination protein n=1 Tax=Bacillus sp. FJAT-27251 TaxID=1684142 RepID=UPI0006A775D2|nr:Ger(x)C family spore germination protein [Bacillus sp. FJAT-27251]